MRTVLLVFCALRMMNMALEAKKKAASQDADVSKQHKAQSKKIAKSHKAHKVKQHRQKVN
jgi:hypothetical protein